MTAPDIVLPIDQPYASLIMAGVKRFETRPAPPNGDMRPDGVRGLPGARVNRGDRLLIASTSRMPRGSALRRVAVHLKLGWGVRGDGWYLHDRPDGDNEIPLPLGCILGSVTVTDAYRMVGPSCIADFAHLADGVTETVVSVGDRLSLIDFTNHSGWSRDDDIADQLPLGDWTPGRWAWALTDPTPLDEPIPVTGKQGVLCPKYRGGDQ